jgi:predicted MPP superfamily phosphohydrolase
LIEPAVETVLSLEPDVIVVTGDFVTRVSHGEPDMIEQTLSRLHAPYGVFAVLGNHDWWENASFVRDAVKQTGIRDLNNEHISWQRGGQSLYLAGLDDVLCGKQDFAAALRGIPAGAAIVALIHEPDYADVTANDPRVILQLSGHSHGGQVRVPYIGGIMFPPLGRKYTIGLNYVRDLVVYTNRGIGVIGPPIRVACRPEITLFTLKPG